MSQLAGTAIPKITPTVSIDAPQPSVYSASGFGIEVSVYGGDGNQAPSGTVKPTSGTFSASQPTEGYADFVFAPGSLPVGTDPLVATYTPDAQSSPIYNNATRSSTVTVIKYTPWVGVDPYNNPITASQSLTVGVGVESGNFAGSATGAVTLTSGS